MIIISIISKEHNLFPYVRFYDSIIFSTVICIVFSLSVKSIDTLKSLFSLFEEFVLKYFKK